MRAILCPNIFVIFLPSKLNYYNYYKLIKRFFRFFSHTSFDIDNFYFKRATVKPAKILNKFRLACVE